MDDKVMLNEFIIEALNNSNTFQIRSAFNFYEKGLRVQNFKKIDHFIEITDFNSDNIDFQANKQFINERLINKNDTTINTSNDVISNINQLPPYLNYTRKYAYDHAFRSNLIDSLIKNINPEKIKEIEFLLQAQKNLQNH